MARRTILIAGDTAAHRAWIAAAVSASFQTPTRFPNLRRSKAEPVPEERLPDLFRDLLGVQDAPSEPEAPEPVGMPVGDLLRSHFGEALPGASALTLRRRELKRQREAKAKVEGSVIIAEEPAPHPVAEPVLELTFEMGDWMKSHGQDRIIFERDWRRQHTVACPPFHLHEDDHSDPVDQFLGQVVGVKVGRALLFRRRDPAFMDSCEVGQRYVLVRFWDDENGEAWSMPVEGEEDDAVMKAIRATVGLYRRGRRRTA